VTETKGIEIIYGHRFSPFLKVSNWSSIKKIGTLFPLSFRPVTASQHCYQEHWCDDIEGMINIHFVR